MVELTYELHLHSCLSPCGDDTMTPNNIAGMAMLNGVQIAALTDHNTSRNCPAFFEACAKVGVIPVAGMELTTAEEIHMVCLFATLEEALAFDAVVCEHRMKIKNRPDIFGEQQILDGDDELIGIEEDLLIAATDLDLDRAAVLVEESELDKISIANIVKEVAEDSKRRQTMEEKISDFVRTDVSKLIYKEIRILLDK